jgi:hypothetical protein
MQSGALTADTHFSPSLGVKSAALTGGRRASVFPAYHVFNLSKLATPNFYWVFRGSNGSKKTYPIS